MNHSIKIVSRTIRKRVTAQAGVLAICFLVFGVAALLAPTASGTGNDADDFDVRKLAGDWWNWA